MNKSLFCQKHEGPTKWTRENRVGFKFLQTDMALQIVVILHAYPLHGVIHVYSHIRYSGWCVCRTTF